ncbi:ATP-binding cassette domain-containing protein [Actinomycetaceae bacterium L2_0104]
MNEETGALIDGTAGPAVVVENYSFQYNEAKRRAVRDLTFTVEKGSFVCIVGSNGSGKSTLCNALVGLIPHYFVGKYAGMIRVDGVAVASSSVAELSKTIGLVFQNPFNQLSYTAETVAEELAFGLGNQGIAREEMRRRVAEVAKIMRIEHILEKNPLELSGGQVQRVAFGSAFIMEPEILVLDECTTQLDPLGGEELIDIVKRLNSTGVTVIMVDHDMERVARNADKVLVLDRGRLLAQGSPREIFAHAAHCVAGVDAPDYVKVSRALATEGLGTGGIEITEEPTVELIRKALL